MKMGDNMSKNSWKTNFRLSVFRCKECGFDIPLPRNAGRMREKGHIKDVFCAHCNKVTKHKEIRTKYY